MLGFTQYNVRGQGHEGTNACVAIGGSFMASFLCHGIPISKCLSTENLRLTCKQQVQHWAARNSTNAADPGVYIGNFLGSLGSVGRSTSVLADNLSCGMVRVLCATQRPFTIAVTVPHVPGDGLLRCYDPSFTFTISPKVKYALTKAAAGEEVAGEEASEEPTGQYAEELAEVFPQSLEERAPWVAAVEEAKASKAEGGAGSLSNAT